MSFHVSLHIIPKVYRAMAKAPENEPVPNIKESAKAIIKTGMARRMLIVALSILYTYLFAIKPDAQKGEAKRAAAEPINVPANDIFTVSSRGLIILGT